MDGRGIDETTVQRLLGAHARTFSLTLRLLPRSLRESLGIAYLLARASDTVADTCRIPRDQRVKMLEELAWVLDEGESVHWKPEIEPWHLSTSERELIEALPELEIALGRLSDRGELLRLWRTILEGQLFDLRRFTPHVAPLSREELEGYCYLVAGSVGETWTRLIGNHAPGVLHPVSGEMEKMMAWGISYGKGLQLLNILRDRVADQGLGRIYVLEENVRDMAELAAAWLDQGRCYCEALVPGRLRYATEIPLRLAAKTLDRIRSAPETQRAKMPRWEVYGVLVKTLPSLVLP